MSVSVTWYRLTPIRKPKGWKDRLGDYGIDSEGTLWIPAETLGNPLAVGLCAVHDGTPMLRGPGGHVHIPIEWAIDGYGRTRDEDLAHVKARILESHRAGEVTP